MKLCKDCKHFAGIIAEDECKHPNNFTTTTNLVSGCTSSRANWHTAQILRSDNYLSSLLNGTCGKSGRWFVLKDSPKDGEAKEPL